MADRSVPSIHVSAETRERLELLAAQQRRSVASLAEDAIQRHLAEEDSFVASVQAGIADAEAGRTMSSDAARQRIVQHIERIRAKHCRT